jgi:hypothetical protein
VVEVARLESVYRFIAYPGFESPSLRQEYKCKNGHPRVAFLHLFHGGEKQSACALCEGDSKAVALQGAAGPRNVAESLTAIASDGGVRRGHTCNPTLPPPAAARRRRCAKRQPHCHAALTLGNLRRASAICARARCRHLCADTAVAPCELARIYCSGRAKCHH